MATASHTYHVHARSCHGGTAIAEFKGQQTAFDASAGQGDDLPGPADLLTAAFGACVIKNVERFSHLLPFAYEQASIDVTAQRQDAPPRITSVRYVLHVTTDEPERRVELLHDNIRRFGTIYNTLAAVSDVNGEIVAEPAGAHTPS